MLQTTQCHVHLTLWPNVIQKLVVNNEQWTLKVTAQVSLDLLSLCDSSVCLSEMNCHLSLCSPPQLSFLLFSLPPFIIPLSVLSNRGTIALSLGLSCSFMLRVDHRRLWCFNDIHWEDCLVAVANGHINSWNAVHAGGQNSERTDKLDGKTFLIWDSLPLSCPQMTFFVLVWCKKAQICSPFSAQSCSVHSLVI